MKRLLLSVLLLFIAAPIAITFTSTDVWAVGAPTDNYTIPDLPTNDPTHEEKKPAVNFYLKGTTAQTKTSPASFNTSFIGPLEQNKYTVVGERQWYLNVDINTPGWLYIYEYYPPDNNPSGQWLAYKWQLKQSGVWEIGPFNAGPDEPEGQHVYRLWFYGNGQWATTDLDKPSSLIYWAYLKDFPELKIMSFSASYQEIKRADNVTLSWNVQGAQSMEISTVGPITGASGAVTITPDRDTDFVLIATGLDGRQVTSDPVKVIVSEHPTQAQTPSSPASPTPDTNSQSLLDQLSTPITLISILSVIVIIVLGVLLRIVYIRRWANNTPAAAPAVEQHEEIAHKVDAAIAAVAVAESAVTARARLTMPGGLEIALTTGSRSIGRAELARALGLDELCLISRQQFQVTCTNGSYFIEDAGSINGTKLNGEEIKGKGTVALKDGDIIEPASAMKLKFSVYES